MIHKLSNRLHCGAAFAALATALAASAASAQTSASPYTSAARFDAMGRQTGAISPDPDGAGPLAFAAVRNSYDAAGRLVKVEKGELAQWQSEGVAPANWSAFTVFQTVESEYDARDRKVKERLIAAGAVQSLTQTTYDLNGRPICHVIRMNQASFSSPLSSACAAGPEGSDGADRITRSHFDEAGQLIQVRKGVGTTAEAADATYEYSLNGLRRAVIDGNGNRAAFRYDGHDRLICWLFPSPSGAANYDGSSPKTALATAGNTNGDCQSTGDFEAYGYDLNGNRTRIRNRAGEEIVFAYDGLNRLTIKDLPGAERDVAYTYDLRGLQRSATFTGTGEAVMTDYDGFGQVVSSTTTMGGVSRKLESHYNLAGNRTRLTHPDGTYFTYTYDGLNRVTQIQENGSSLLAKLDYDAQGRRESVTRGNGTVTAYAYDPASRLQQLSHDLAGPGHDQQVTFTYNRASQIVTRVGSNDAYSVTGLSNGTQSTPVNGLNQIVSVAGAQVLHDAKGNMTRDWSPQTGVSTYGYTSENTMASAVNTAGSFALSYDPLMRLHQVSGGSGERFLYDGANLVAEYDSAGVLVRRYVHGPGVDDPIVQYHGLGTTTRLFLHADERGSVIALSEGTGYVAAVNRYDEYGIPGDTNQGRFQYTGQTWLPEMKLYNYKARLYNPRTGGRFMQVDPIGYDDQINLYLYVGGDPINSTDSSGRFRDIYIGGAGDAPTGIVGRYEQYQSDRNPDRDIRFRHWNDIESIKNDIETTPPGEPINIIGHSLGGAEAIRQAMATRRKIDTLITIDPVDLFEVLGTFRMSNVVQWVNVTANPERRDWSDTVASAGGKVRREVTERAHVRFSSPQNHYNFPAMMREINARRALDRTYRRGKVDDQEY